MNKANKVSDAPQSKDEATIHDSAPAVGLGQVANIFLFERSQVVEGIETLNSETITSGLDIKSDPLQRNVHRIAALPGATSMGPTGSILAKYVFLYYMSMS
jgi:hypothetical protein